MLGPHLLLLLLLLPPVLSMLPTAFCLPLDFISQVVLTSIFFSIQFQSTVAQMAYPLQLLLQRMPQLLRLQLCLERAAATAAQCVLRAGLLLQRATGSSSSSSGLHGSSSAAVQDGVCVLNGTAALDQAAATAGAAAGLSSGSCSTEGFLAAVLQQQQQQDLEQFSQLPGRAPDVSSLAGRFILAGCCTWMFFVVLLLPLYVAWHVQRNSKAKWLQSMLQQQQQQQQRSDANQQQQQSGCAVPPAASAGACGTLSPTHAAHVRHLGLLLLLSVALSEGIVLALCLNPNLQSLLWKQVVYYEYLS
jgi:cytochrome b561